MEICTKPKEEKKTLAAKHEFIACDVCKLILAILVVVIHTAPLSGISDRANHLLVEGVCRVAVPYFFITSGFFLAPKLGDKKALIKYIKRILIMYAVASVIYIPIHLLQWYGRHAQISFVDYFKQVFIGVLQGAGFYGHLWYLQALIVGTLLLYLLTKVLKVKTPILIIIAVLLYLFGVCEKGYYGLIKQIPAFDAVICAYKSIFNDTGNGVFFGLPYLTIGCLLSENRSKIIKLKYWAMFLASLVLLLTELVLLTEFTEINAYSMTLSIPVASTFLFLFTAFIDVDEKYSNVGIWCRKASIIVYLYHQVAAFTLLYIYIYLRKGITNLAVFIVTIAACLIFSAIVIHLEKRFKWLRYLH